jgi:hypothetical protein
VVIASEISERTYELRDPFSGVLSTSQAMSPSRQVMLSSHRGLEEARRRHHGDEKRSETHDEDRSRCESTMSRVIDEVVSRRP